MDDDAFVAICIYIYIDVFCRYLYNIDRCTQGICMCSYVMKAIAWVRLHVVSGKELPSFTGNDRVIEV